jgi:hypothetical protein
MNQFFLSLIEPQRERWSFSEWESGRMRVFGNKVHLFINNLNSFVFEKKGKFKTLIGFRMYNVAKLVIAFDGGNSIHLESDITFVGHKFLIEDLRLILEMMKTPKINLLLSWLPSILLGYSSR